MSEKQKQILQVALRLFVEQGFHGTPTSQIAKEAGVSNGTLFHYYKTKDELVLALYNSIKDQLQAYLQAQLDKADTIEDKFKISFISSLDWALENALEFYYIQQFHFSPHLSKVPVEVLQQQTQWHMDLIREAVDKKLIRSLPVDFLFTLISSQVFGLYGYLANSGLSSPARKSRVAEGFDMLWQMLKA